MWKYSICFFVQNHLEAILFHLEPFLHLSLVYCMMPAR